MSLANLRFKHDSCQRLLVGRWRPFSSKFLLPLLLACACAHAQAPAAPAAPSREQAHEALERVRADPLLGHLETRKELRLKKRDEQKAPAKDSNWDWTWLTNFMKWLGQTARVLLWVFGALAAAFVLLRIGRWMKARGALEPLPRAALPSHVQNLDIRPESLPDVIGAAAAELWQRGQQRAALSLLYRGALSRLVHMHALPIRAASTEGECLALASQRLDAPRANFFGRLVDMWLPAVYGAHMPRQELALNLCREFDLQFAPAVARVEPA